MAIRIGTSNPRALLSAIVDAINKEHVARCYRRLLTQSTRNTSKLGRLTQTGISRTQRHSGI